MALANKAVQLARIEHRRQRCMLIPGPFAKPAEQLEILFDRRKQFDFAEIPARVVKHALRGAECGVGARPPYLRMEFGQPLRQMIKMTWLKRCAACHPIKQRAFKELSHPDGILGGVSRPAYGRPRYASGDWNDIKVKLWRGAAIEAQLFIAVMPPCLERAEIQKAERDWPLDLVCIIAGQQHPRDVGFNYVNALHRVRIAGRIAQCGYQTTRC
jgi:hypothetical protein